MKSFFLLLIVLLCSIESYCQLQFNSDTLFSVLNEEDSVWYPVIGQKWLLYGNINDDTIQLVHATFFEMVPQFSFQEDGGLIIDACFLSCGEPSCLYMGNWKENKRGILKLKFRYPKYIFRFQYKYSENMQKLNLKKLSPKSKSDLQLEL